MKFLQSFLRRLSGSFAPSLQERMTNLSVSFFLHDYFIFIFYSGHFLWRIIPLRETLR